MARTKGSRNVGTAERRRQMIDRMRGRLGQWGAARASWRELAAAAEVSLATLSHHFGKRDDVIRAILEANGADGSAPLAVLATPAGEFADSIRLALEHLASGLRVGVGDMIAVGLVEGLRQPGLGEVFVDASLEPIIAAASHRLREHQRRGQMRAADARHAAIQLVAPLLLSHLHQAQLGGAPSHPLDIDALIEDTAQAFVRAYRPEGDGA